VQVVEEIETFEGRTTGGVSGGTVQLDSDLIITPVQYLQIPPGMVLRIWGKRISGLTPVTFIWSYSTTASTGPFTEVSRDAFPGPVGGASELVVEKKRPIILRGITGNEGLQITWVGAPTGASVNSIEFEGVYGSDVLDEPLW
jgi:hypothetical protein